MKRILCAFTILAAGCGLHDSRSAVPSAHDVDVKYGDSLIVARRIGVEVGQGWDWSRGAYKGVYTVSGDYLKRLSSPAVLKVSLLFLSGDNSASYVILDRLNYASIEYSGPAIPSRPLRSTGIGRALATTTNGARVECYCYGEEVSHHTNGILRNQVVLEMLFEKKSF